MVSSGRASLTGSLTDSAFELKVGAVVAVRVYGMAVHVASWCLQALTPVVPKMHIPGRSCSSCA